MAALKDRIAALETRAAGNPAAMVTLARMLQEDGQRERALAMCRDALLLAPDDALLAAKAQRLVTAGVPRWHFDIVKDEARNAAYDAALRRAMRPGWRVLEIGTGTGLLAMMAARAGAAEVITCEQMPAIAEKAAEIVAVNGYSDRIRVVARHSDRLDAQADMGGRADMLVSEIIASDILGEDVLPAHERAVRDLLKPGGRVIPARGIVRVALAYDAREDMDVMADIAGFDLSAFTSLAPSVRRIRAGQSQILLRSDAADLFVFDFSSPHYCGPSQTSLMCLSEGGPVNGIVQWIALELDEVTRYENRPGPGSGSSWAVLFHPFMRTIDSVDGQEFRILGSHDRQSLTICADADGSAVSWGAGMWNGQRGA